MNRVWHGRDNSDDRATTVGQAIGDRVTTKSRQARAFFREKLLTEDVVFPMGPWLQLTPGGKEASGESEPYFGAFGAALAIGP